MKQFLVLYHASPEARDLMSKVTPEQAKAGMDFWMQWAAANQKNIVDLGKPVGNARRVVRGTISNSSSTVSGFSILQAESIEAATKMVSDHPHFHTPGEAAVDVFEVMPIPGM
jgi:hypothetical protein